MAVLGKVGMNPKGEWASGAAYERLDIVSHLGASYLALTDTAVEPSDDGANWMMLAEGISTEGVKEIIDQSLVGLDADTVDGFHASYDNTAGTAVIRGADKSVNVGAIISDIANDENPVVSQVVVTNGADNQLRKANIARLFGQFGIYAVEARTSFSLKNYMGSSSSRFVRIANISVSGWTGPMMRFCISERGGAYRKGELIFSDSSVSSIAIDKFQVTKSLYSHDSGYTGKNATPYLVKKTNTSYDLYMYFTTNGNFAFWGDATAGATVDTSCYSSDPLTCTSLPAGYITAAEVTSLIMH